MAVPAMAYAIRQYEERIKAFATDPDEHGGHPAQLLPARADDEGLGLDVAPGHRVVGSGQVELRGLRLPGVRAPGLRRIAFQTCSPRWFASIAIKGPTSMPR